MQRIHLKFAAIFVPFYFGLMGCGLTEKLEKDGSKTKSTTTIVALDPGDSLITAADLAPTPGFTLSSLEATDVIAKLNQSSDSYVNKPDPLSETACGKLMGEIQVKANAKSMLLSATIDNTACANQDKKDESFNFTQASVKMRFYAACSSGDLSSLNGTKLKSINDISLFKLCKSGAIWSEMKVITNRMSLDPENPYSLDSTYTYYAGDQKLKGCKFTVSKDIASYPEGCISVEKIDDILKRSEGVKNFSDFAKYTKNKMTFDATSTTDVWYSSGTIDVTVNDWKGTLTYTGAANPPRYVLSQDTASAAITGKLTATAALHLTDSAKRQHLGIRSPLATFFGK